jgi:hypothetical protein
MAPIFVAARMTELDECSTYLRISQQVSLFDTPLMLMIATL